MDLSATSTPDLERLKGALERGELGIPLSAHGLRSLALSALVPHEPALSGLGREAARLLITAVLRERVGGERRPELVWTGPETKQSGARDTAVVLSDLFSAAQQSVLLAGFVFDHGVSVLSALHQAMLRGVSCRLFADGDAARNFRRDSWPFGPPFPEILRFVPAAGIFASLHANPQSPARGEFRGAPHLPVDSRR